MLKQMVPKIIKERVDVLKHKFFIEKLIPNELYNAIKRDDVRREAINVFNECHLLPCSSQKDKYIIS